MTTSSELFERRAERGHPRGAGTVWAAARRQSARGRHGPAPAGPIAIWGFRLALALWMLAVGLGAVLAAHDGPAGPPAATSAGQSTPASPGSPDPILVDGMSLVDILPPLDPDACCRDALFERFTVRGGGDGVVTTGDHAPGQTRWQVFADPADPFARPVLGIEILPGGGFRPWGVNVDGQALSDLVDRLVRRDGSWTIDPDTGLEQVADFTDDETAFRAGWQFDFSNGAERSIWQAEPGRDAGVWLWLARMVAGRDATSLAAAPITVLGHPGVAIGIADPDGGSDGDSLPDEVIWEHDDLVYRLMASRIENDTLVPRDPTGTVDRLRLADRATWVSAVDNAGRRTAAATAAFSLLLVAMVAVVASAGWFLWKGPRRLALVGLLAVVPWATFSSSSGYGYPAALLAAVGLAWWYRHRSEAVGYEPA